MSDRTITTAIAPGKIILVGEHAVVYGRPAIAAPVWQVTATATIVNAPHHQGCTLSAPDVDLHFALHDTSDEQPLALVTRLALAQAGVVEMPDWRIELHSTIPIAGGLGSGAALSTALVRAIFAHVSYAANADAVSSLVYESERFYHGTPSGIDNTVIAYGQPIWFVKGKPAAAFAPHRAFLIAIADSGVRSPTKETVGAVRRAWELQPELFEGWFDEIAEIVHSARLAIEQGELELLGELLNRNQTLLAQIGVSAEPLEQMIAAARTAGALGAKLSGGGRGGNVIALVESASAAAVHDALLAAGAQRVILTEVR